MHHRLHFHWNWLLYFANKYKNTCTINCTFETGLQRSKWRKSQIHLPSGWNLRLKDYKILLKRLSIFCQKCNWYSWNTSLGISRNLWYIVLRICLYTKGRNSKEWKNVLVMMGVEAMSSELWTFQCLMCKEMWFYKLFKFSWPVWFVANSYPWNNSISKK